MAFFISVGSVGTSRNNKHRTGARGYEIVRNKNKVICRWAGIYVLGPTDYFWRRRPAVTPYRRGSIAAAKELYSKRVKQLQYSSEAYVPLGPGVRIKWHPRATSAVAEVRSRLGNG
jgi:hypothetical protein